MGKLGERVDKESKFLQVAPGESAIVKIPAGEDYWVAKVNQFGTQVYQLTVIDGDNKKLMDINPFIAGQIDSIKESKKQGEVIVKISRSVKNSEGKTKYSVTEETEIPF